MDGEVGNHAFGNKKLPAVVPDKVGVLFRGKFPRNGKHEPPGKLGVVMLLPTHRNLLLVPMQYYIKRFWLLKPLITLLYLDAKKHLQSNPLYYYQCADMLL